MFWQLFILLVVLIPLLAIVLDSRVGEALASRLERGSPGPGSDRIAQRLRTLEAEVERLTTEVARLEEESDFLHKLLNDRHSARDSDTGRIAPGGPGSAPPPRRESSASPEESTLPTGDDGD